MDRSYTFAMITIALLMTAGLSALPTSMAVDQNEAQQNLVGALDVFARPKIEILACFLANESSNMNGTATTNLTGQQIDVYKNFTFVVSVSDHDTFTPNISYIHNLTLVGFVNFEGDPTALDPSDPNAEYDKRNYEFQFNATRLNGGGDIQSNWDLNLNYPSSPDEEVVFFPDNSSWVNEGDGYKSDGVNDTIEFRWAFALGNQSRNTNASGSFQADDWEFYVEVTDVFGVTNSSKDEFEQKFDVFQSTRIQAGGQVAGRDVPGGGSFKLMNGPQQDHMVHFAANNNATFLVNATNLSTPQWKSSTLMIAPGNVPIGDPAWVQIQADFVAFEEREHAVNGTKSKAVPLDGENPSVHAFWMCTGIPAGMATGGYTSDVTFMVRITGT